MLTSAALLGALSVTGGLGVAGWVAGLATACGTTALLTGARFRSGRADEPAGGLGHPDPGGAVRRGRRSRGGLLCSVDTSHRTGRSRLRRACPGRRGDGWVAWRTGTATTAGARFDAEVDAFLILLLSVEVSRDYGLWVLVIGAARYAYWLRDGRCGGSLRPCRPGTGAKSSPPSRASC